MYLNICDIRVGAVFVCNDQRESHEHSHVSHVVYWVASTACHQCMFINSHFIVPFHNGCRLLNALPHTHTQMHGASERERLKAAKERMRERQWRRECIIWCKQIKSKIMLIIFLFVRLVTIYSDCISVWIRTILWRKDHSVRYICHLFTSGFQSNIFENSFSPICSNFACSRHVFCRFKLSNSNSCFLYAAIRSVRCFCSIFNWFSKNFRSCCSVACNSFSAPFAVW